MGRLVQAVGINGVDALSRRVAELIDGLASWIDDKWQSIWWVCMARQQVKE